MKNSIDLVMASLMLHSGFVCIAIHVCAFCKSRESLNRAVAGIKREFDPKRFSWI